MASTPTCKMPQNCHICKKRLKLHPLYQKTVGMQCPDHGDFFVQELRGEEPYVTFRPFDSVVIHRHKEPGHPGTAVLCEQTGETFISVKAAGEKLGISRTRISMNLTGNARHVSGYTFVRIDKESLPEDFRLKPRNTYKGGARVRVRCDQTGDEFDAVRLAAKKLNIHRNYIFRHLNNPERYPRVKGYSFTKLG